MLRSTISNWREYLTPITHKSTFLNTGQITPEEFIEAGDYLVHMFPTWKWNEESGNISYREFLPKDKQFLVSRKVPCQIRASDFFNIDESEDFDEETTKTKSFQKEVVGSKTDIEDIDDVMQAMELSEHSGNELNDICDEVIPTDTNKNRRYYDLFITYSTSYRVPKMYIVGFNVEGTPLTPDQMFEDISLEYRDKTATIEKLPFYKNSILSVSIHPCKHANVMKVLLEKVRLIRQRKRSEEKKLMDAKHNQDNQDEWEDLQEDVNDTLRADQYLVIFLKFITSITPTIEHDYTMEGW